METSKTNGSSLRDLSDIDKKQSYSLNRSIPNNLMSGSRERLATDPELGDSTKSKKQKDLALLHKQEKGDFTQDQNLIDNFDFTNSDAPQWLIYSWLLPRNQQLTERRAITGFCELLTLKQYSVLIAIAYNVGSSTPEATANALWTVSLGFGKMGIKVPAVEKRLLKDTIKFSSNAVNSKNEPLNRQATMERSHTLSLLEALIVEEIQQQTLQESQIFRSNNAATKVLALFAETMSKSLLKHLLQPFFSDIQSWPAVIELDPMKLDKQLGEKQAQELIENSRRWMYEKCGRLVKGLRECCVSSFDTPFSPGLRYLLGLIQAAIIEKFPSESSFGPKVHSAVVGFLFLRIICPTICSPEKHNELLPVVPMNDPSNPTEPLKMVPVAIQPQQRRALILASKILQNLANGLLFGAKESYLLSCNSFIENHKEPLYMTIESILRLEFQPADMLQIISSLPEPKGREIHSNALALLETVTTQMDKITARLAPVHVNEVVTYTVYGAVKSVLNRIEQVEQLYLESKLVPGADRARIDAFMTTQWVLLGGLEECLLMNRAVIIRILLLSMMSKNQKLDQIPVVRASEKFDLCKAIVQMIAQHGRQRICDIVEWAIEWECHDIGHDERLQKVSFRSASADESGPKQPTNDDMISPHLIQILFLVHSKENKALQSTVEKWLVEAMEDEELSEKFNLIFKLDETGNFRDKSHEDGSKSPTTSKNESIRAWIDVSCNLLTYLSNNISWLDGSLSRFTGFLLTFLPDKGPSKKTDGEMWVSSWLIAHLICPILLLAPSSELQRHWTEQWKTRTSFRNSIMTTNAEDSFGEKRRHLYVLVASMLRWLTTQTRNPADEHSETELSLWWKTSLKFRNSLVSAIINVQQQNLTDDSPIHVTSSRRARSIWLIRSFLKQDFLQSLKSRQWIEPRPDVDTRFKKFRFRTVQEDLVGSRMETVHYSLADRTRTMINSLYADPSDKKATPVSTSSALSKSVSMPRDLVGTAGSGPSSHDHMLKEMPPLPSKSSTINPKLNPIHDSNSSMSLDRTKMNKSTTQIPGANGQQPPEKRGFLHLLRNQLHFRLGFNQRTSGEDDDDDEEDEDNGEDANVMINVNWADGKQSTIRLSGNPHKNTSKKP